MCGIFGLIARDADKVPVKIVTRLLYKLFEESESRGKDASGILAISENEIVIHKEPRRAKLMLKSANFATVLAEAERSYLKGNTFFVAGHTRMVTNGSEDNEGNNQPVVKDKVVLLHNGIIVNDQNLWEKHPNWERRFQVDTEIFGAIIMARMNVGGSFAEAVNEAFAATKGANTVAAIHADESEMLLGTTNGSLYFWNDPYLGITIFGSEKYIIEQIVPSLASLTKVAPSGAKQVVPGSVLALRIDNGFARLISSGDPRSDTYRTCDTRRIRLLSAAHLPLQRQVTHFSNTYGEIERLMHYDSQMVTGLKRCTKCLLPSTFPFIEYDSEGVCQFCRHHRSVTSRGATELQVLANQWRRVGGQADCLVPISGGRDSCYGLHYIKKELGLNPVAYTYDWGFVTDLARRNISRMCGELNIEHVLVAADIKLKRENVRKNVSAWLKKPKLSMIPLFMAGDKQFFHYASKIKKQMGLGPILYSMNWLEKTGFKTGFAGVNDTAFHKKTHGLTSMNQLKLLGHYGYNFLSNPHYLNGSIIDTLFGYFSFYLKQMDYYQIFDYISWSEDEIERCIIKDYGWETSPDTKSTWRIGDGTAPFYNYIYLTIAGFTENDTFRSNQIREGLIDRATALKAVEEENRPRIESFKWYCDTIGLDAVAALKTINSTKKLYL